MAEYITKEAAIEAFENGEADVIEYYVDGCDFGFGLKNIKSMINFIPAADVAPVVHGRWILERTPYGEPYCYHCSACNDDFHHIGITVASDYCPHCGAKMDGGVAGG